MNSRTDAILDANVMTIDDSDRVLIGEYYNYNHPYQYLVIFRYDADGKVDSSFGTNGVDTISIPGYNRGKLSGIVTQPDGEVVLAMSVTNASSYYRDLVVVRRKSTGAPDTSFHQVGFITKNFYDYDVTSGAVVIGPDGKACQTTGVV